jgi:hypothetical protein
VFLDPLPKRRKVRAPAPAAASAEAGVELPQVPPLPAPLAPTTEEAADGEAPEVDEDDVLLAVRTRQRMGMGAAGAATASDDEESDGAAGEEHFAEPPRDPELPRPVGNPQRCAPGRGGNNQQRRHRPAGEPTNAQRRARRARSAAEQRGQDAEGGGRKSDVWDDVEKNGAGNAYKTISNTC